MRDFPWRGRRYNRHWLRGRELADRDLGPALYPTPEQMLRSIGALVLAALLVGVAVEALVRAFGN